ncbi:MAG: radical SAM protein [Elusimicrobia bacterium]|nr:radical SAM protein [Elusimicrobiota bacterium]
MRSKIPAELEKGNFTGKTLAAALLLRGAPQRELFGLARKARSLRFGSGKVEVRSVIEVSNICRQSCRFCNINGLPNGEKYLLDRSQVLRIVRHLYRKKRRVLLLQSGENNSKAYINLIARCVADIKKEFSGLTVILSMGSLGFAQYKQLRRAGADRYILKFETSDPALYKRIKPGDSLANRLKCVKFLTDLGFETGSGNMIGLPGQTIYDIVNDLRLAGKLGLTMASSSVFVPGEGSVYYDRPMGDLNLTLNYMALLRILYPHLLIPTTSALEKAGKNGQFLGLMAGANTVTVHDGTPPGIKRHFPIYSLDRFTPNEKHIRRIVARAKLRFKL